MFDDSQSTKSNKMKESNSTTTLFEAIDELMHSHCTMQLAKLSKRATRRTAKTRKIPSRGSVLQITLPKNKNRNG